MEYVIATMGTNRFFANQLYADIPDNQMCAQPGAIRNHPAWTMGHIVLALDGACATLGLEKQKDADWEALFGQRTLPATERGKYPTKNALLADFQMQMDRLEQKLKAADEATLAAENPVEHLRPIFPTVGALVVALATTHTAMHLGQVSAWRREAQMKRVLPSDQDLEP